LPRSNGTEYADRTIAAYRWKASQAIANWGKVRKPSKFLQRFLESVPADGIILDYGCGIGTDMVRMQQQGVRVEGIDGTGEFVEEAQRRCPGVGIRCERFETVRLPLGRYDGIWCNAALLHVPPKELVDQLEKLRSALKASGILGITLAWGSRRGFTQRDWIPGRYVAGYTRQQAAHFFQGWRVEGLKVVSQDGRKGRWIQVLATA
jgi:SAM-dependent methyltransferase